MICRVIDGILRHGNYVGEAKAGERTGRAGACGVARADP
jgi:hypothetical protein